MPNYTPLTAIILSSALLVGGCATESKIKQQSLPEWFYNPHTPGYVGVASSAPTQKMGGLEGQRRYAILKARAEMARMQNVQVQSESNISQKVSNSGVKVSYDDFRKLSSAQTLDLYNVEIKDEWVNPETGELFLWLSYPVN